MSTTSVGEVYRDILLWGLTLPLWQQELLRRVLPERDLSASNIEELAAAAVAESEQQASAYSPLSASDLPAVASTETAKTLIGIREVRSVNALRSDQNLTFGSQLTVIYGDNGSGKSGYARVLKKVYRARVVDDILGNLTSEEPSLDPCGATFTLKTPDGPDEVVEWKDGTPAVSIGRFAVLDPACAGTYIRGGTLAVGPAGIDVPRRFVAELDRVKALLSRQIATAVPNKSELQRFENDTAAGRFIKGLSSATSDAAIVEFETWTPEHERDLQACERAIAEGIAQTPSARRAQREARLRAFESIHKRLSGWLNTVRDEAVNVAGAAARELKQADATVLATQSLDDSVVDVAFLQGRPWLELLRAASRYVQSLQGHAELSGLASVDGRCALCWQPLDTEAQMRVQRFHEHLEGTAVKEQKRTAETVDTIRRSFEAIPHSLTPEELAILETEAGVLPKVLDLMSGVRGRRDAVLAFIAHGKPIDELSAIGDAALVALMELAESTRRDLAALPATDADGEAQLKALAKTALELTTRRSVSNSVASIRTFIATTRERQRLTQAEQGINSRAASLKATDLHKTHMTARYAALVDDELRELRFRRRRPTLSQATNKGSVQVTPLVAAELSHISAEKVFSEGERTAIALACFLAEMRLGDDPSGLIFDDPISSLDHNVREHVARRLVAAAKGRQVIVFTHDLAFLADLREQSKKIQDVDCTFRTLVASDFHAGFVEPEEPFGARTVKKRIGALKTILVDVERAAKNGDMTAFRLHSKDFYEKLRSTWERFIEERLFAMVVQRLERNVIAGALAKVAYTPSLGEKVHEGWRRCSNVLEAHDHAPAAGGHSYSFEDMKADLQQLLDADAEAPAGN